MDQNNFFSRLKNAPLSLMILKATKRGALLSVGIVPFLWICVLLQAVLITVPLSAFFLMILFDGPDWSRMVKEYYPLFLLIVGFGFYLIFATKKIVGGCAKFIKRNW